MKILLYRGRSLISRLIQFQTRSDYSHVALMMDDCSVYEAWHVGGVRHLRSPFDGHSSGTYIDIFRITDLRDCDVDQVEFFLSKQLGKKYDFASVVRFITRREAPADDKWFCSELVLAALKRGGVELLRLPPSEASPRDVSISPLLQYDKTIDNFD